MQFALFGAGRVGWVHAQNIANHPDAKLSHVYDVDVSASRRMVAAVGGKVAETPEEIWAADAVDAVLVASSTNTHIDLLRGAMRAGKAVYCEKPIDIDLAKVRTSSASCASRRRVRRRRMCAASTASAARRFTSGRRSRAGRGRPRPAVGMAWPWGGHKPKSGT